MCCGFQGSWGAKMGKDAPTLKRQERREAAVHRERERELQRPAGIKERSTLDAGRACKSD